jgi:hypothetical protein
MQFSIRFLLGLMVAVSFLCGIIFAAPPIVATPILIGLLWISPALWINGIVYGRGAWRPFFIGGTIAGLVPHLASLYMSVMGVAAQFDVDAWAELFETSGEGFPNMYSALVFLAPGPFAIIGGLVGVWTWWMFQPGKAASIRSEPSTSTPTAHEYLIVSGRLRAHAPGESRVGDGPAAETLLVGGIRDNGRQE